MLDCNNLVKNIDAYIKRLNNRGQDFTYLNELVTAVKERNKLIFNNDNLRKKRNNDSKQIAILVRENYKNPEIEKIKTDIKKIKSIIEQNEHHIADFNAKILEYLLKTPNLPHENCPIGKSDKFNVEIRKWGNIDLSKNKAHWDITSAKKLVEYNKIVNNSGARFVGYINDGAILKRGLMNFILDEHHSKGYHEINLPILVNEKCMFGTGQFPKFIEDAYICKNNMVLIPTAEVSVTNFHREEIFNVEDLPKKYCCFSECFRKEAGSAGKDTRGIIRLHQFSKVELVKFVKPENSYDELEKLVNDAEALLQKLNIPYRVIELCSGDLGFSAAKTYDIEVWMPSRQGYMEISSCSNFEDYQARRMNIKYKDGDKKTFIHTLNGSGLPLDRLIAAFIENYYDEKSEMIKIPTILQKYLFGKTKI